MFEDGSFLRLAGAAREAYILPPTGHCRLLHRAGTKSGVGRYKQAIEENDDL